MDFYHFRLWKIFVVNKNIYTDLCDIIRELYRENIKKKCAYPIQNLLPPQKKE